MPKHPWHDQKKNHDFVTNTFLASNPNIYTDWEIITLFYSALHYVDSYLSNAYRIDFVQDHDQRKDYVRSFLPTINKAYLNLLYLSIDSRYNTNVSTPDLAKAQAYYETIKHALTPVNCPSCGQLNLYNKGKCEACMAPI